MLNGSDEIIDYITEKLGISEGETTADGLFTLKPAECLGACGYAPMMQLGKNYREYLTIEKEFPDQKEVFYAKEADHFHIPAKEDVYTKMEALIWHFKIIMGEIDAPAREVYHSVEAGNGEVGYY